VISVLGAPFRTKDVSSQRFVLNAHPYAATQRNYHANLGRHLNANADALGIKLVSAAPHPRGALWEKRESATSPGRVPDGNGGAVQGQGTGRRVVENQIDHFLREAGLAPAEATDEHGWRRIGFGSTQGFVGTSEVGDIVYLRVVATVVELPSDRELVLPLLRDLLTLNSSLPGPARAAIDGNAVVIAAMMPAEGLSDQYVAFTIHNTMSIADSLVEPLRQQYGGTARKRDGQQR
jgi:hypothetical protein